MKRAEYEGLLMLAAAFFVVVVVVVVDDDDGDGDLETKHFQPLS